MIRDVRSHIALHLSKCNFSSYHSSIKLSSITKRKFHNHRVKTVNNDYHQIYASSKPNILLNVQKRFAEFVQYPFLLNKWWICESFRNFNRSNIINESLIKKKRNKRKGKNIYYDPTFLPSNLSLVCHTLKSVPVIVQVQLSNGFSFYPKWYNITV